MRCYMFEHPRQIKSEVIVTQLLWTQLESATVLQIIEQKRDLTLLHTMIRSIVWIEEKLGGVDHKAYGRAHVYFPSVENCVYTKTSLQRLTKKYFDGSINQLVSFLVIKSNIIANQNKAKQKPVLVVNEVLGRIEDLHPYHIKTVSVPKGEKANEKYAEKGKNAIVEITLKNGKSVQGIKEGTYNRAIQQNNEGSDISASNQPKEA